MCEKNQTTCYQDDFQWKKPQESKNNVQRPKTSPNMAQQQPGPTVIGHSCNKCHAAPKNQHKNNCVHVDVYIYQANLYNVPFGQKPGSGTPKKIDNPARPKTACSPQSGQVPMLSVEDKKIAGLCGKKEDPHNFCNPSQRDHGPRCKSDRFVTTYAEFCGHYKEC